MFHWIDALVQGNVGQAVLAICVVAAIGLGVGSVGLRGVRLGTAGVLFVGIFCGQLGMQIDERILEFVRTSGSFFLSIQSGFRLDLVSFHPLRAKGYNSTPLQPVSFSWEV
jgi:putative transport protein